jgi:hypothetical protein
MHIEEFRTVLRTIAFELESTCIEKEFYQNMLLTSGIVTPEVLQEALEKHLSDPNIQSQTHERFSMMWKALDETGQSALVEDLLSGPPQNGKPN